MSSRFAGRQTQFYIDIIYGLGFSAGFGYLLVVEMDARVAAFQGGLVLGYFLRVWENMSVYEQILQEEVAEEAEAAVAEEVAQQVPGEVEAAVPEKVAQRVEEEVPGKVDQRVEEEIPEKVEQRVEEEVTDRLRDALEEDNGRTPDRTE